NDRIEQIDDSRGQTVRYGYDKDDRLISVTYPSGEILRYTWDSTQHLLTFTAAPNAKVPARVLLRNEYSNGRIAKQTLSDGSVYEYRYSPSATLPIRAAWVKTPEGKVFSLNIGATDSTIREIPRKQNTSPATGGASLVSSQ
ncbi:MAG: RHS repeat domain-containing protein, partial [Acidobacteriaceae bacterium]